MTAAPVILCLNSIDQVGASDQLHQVGEDRRRYDLERRP
jgi:hypothetical protein